MPWSKLVWLAVVAYFATLSKGTTDQDDADIPALPVGEGGDAGDGSKVFETLGPLVVNKDGTLSRISNWGILGAAERETTRRMVGQRNEIRLQRLQGGAQCNSQKDAECAGGTSDEL